MFIVAIKMVKTRLYNDTIINTFLLTFLYIKNAIPCVIIRCRKIIPITRANLGNAFPPLLK